ncbi:unnamed protein product [Pneumocystis jirovecii]|uniref:Vacuolar protein sorting-associated protein 8 central domain-containing protein n=1 Tax=Pneumocystis jirovecii TaxID=42068 RepID=L0PFE1_PNEJI|nr:unnamed protein product [Pneumocystis jirovecii]
MVKNTVKNEPEKIYDENGFVEEKLKKLSVSTENFDQIKKNYVSNNAVSIFQEKSFGDYCGMENRSFFNDYKRAENHYFLVSIFFLKNKNNIIQSTEKTSFSLPSSSIEDRVSEKVAKHSKSYSLTSLLFSSSCFNYSPNSSISVDIKSSEEEKDFDTFKDTIRWCKLKKISSEIFTKLTIKEYGSAMCICISDIIAVGTSKGLILIFDYRQTLKDIIRQKTEAMDFGSVTSMSISNDSMFLCSGHSRGYIFVWELRTPANLILTISPITINGPQNVFNSGHLNNSKICHVAFVNSCRSIVSSDNHGMTFYHIFNRNIISNSVHSIRLTGHRLINSSSNYKESNIVLALTSLSINDSKNTENSVTLIAILMSHKLSIITTSPIRSQFKTTRPMFLKADRHLLGVLSWFSSEKLKKKNIENINKIRLLYSWENYLSVLEIHKEPTFISSDRNIPSLLFKKISQWEEKELILAAQWFNMTIIVLLLRSQKIRIINIETMESFFSCDTPTEEILMLNYYDEKFSENNIIDKTYQENIQISTFCQSIFTTWDYKLSLILNAKKFTKAISLMNLYYEGNCEKAILGLPLDDKLRHTLLEEKLLKIIVMSLKFILHENSSNLENMIPDKQVKKNLALVCIEACINMKMVDFLFDDVYNQFRKTGEEEIFLESIETFVLASKLKIIRPDVMKDIITIFLKKKLYSNLENIIFKIDLISLDIDESLKIFRKEKLYDILIYIWTQAFSDFITPIIHFLNLINCFFKNQQNNEINRKQENNIFPQYMDILRSDINKLFLYLSNSLLGRIYPTKIDMNKDMSILAKSSIYWFIFSGINIIWPKNNGILIKSIIDDSKESTFPYLRLILSYDVPAFLSVLNEAFEDDFLNEIDNTFELSKLSNIKITRQLIINILLEIMEEEVYSQNLIYFYIFIAYNISKYSQFIFLSDSILEKILIELGKNSNEDLSYKCQVSIIHLLSFYKPDDTNYLINLYEKNKFYKVLKFIYKQEKKFSKLLKVHIKDKDNSFELFECIVELFELKNQLNDKKISNLHKVIIEYSEEICSIDIIRFSQIINKYFPELHIKIIEKLEKSVMQYNYLKFLLNPQFFTNIETTVLKNGISIPNNCISNKSWITKEIQELFIILLCNFEPENLTNYIKSLNVNDIDVDNILSILENYRMIDAIIHLLRLNGKVSIAFEKNLEYISEFMLEIDISLKLELKKCIKNPNKLNFDNIKKQFENIEKNIITGISLCEEYFLQLISRKHQDSSILENPFDSSISVHKFQWIRLLEVIIKVSQIMLSELSDQLLKITSESLSYYNSNKNELIIKISDILEKVKTFIRDSVQNIFTSLYNLTSLSSSQLVIFFNILHQFLEMAILFPPIFEIKELLINIFQSYKYDQELLIITNKLLNKDLFKLIKYNQQIRNKGCKVEFSNCEVCKQDLWEHRNTIDFLYSQKKKKQNEILNKKELHDLIENEDILFPEKEIQEKRLHIKHDLSYLKKSEDLSVKNNVFPQVIIFMCGHNYHKDCLYSIEMRKEKNPVCVLCEALILQQQRY